MAEHEPLAFRMRPQKVEEILGQDDIIGPETALYKMIKNGHTPSMLLFGPPGTGKTSMAFAIAQSMDKDFYALNATTDGKKDVEAVIEEARLTRNAIIFIDEIHRFNKSQQDSLLRALESGIFTLIGATTENPFHTVNNAIRSRCGQIKELKLLEKEDIMNLLHHALQEKRGLGNYRINVTDSNLEEIANITGDARTALNILEDAVFASDQNAAGEIEITETTIQECVENKGLLHDKKGDIYYNLLSSFQKSIRGSNVHAGLYYLARLLEGGDLVSICRRILVTAYEDVGLADPALCARVQAAVEAVHRLGLPEARIPLAVVTVELCLSPKSNAAYKGLDKAINQVGKGKTYDIPEHLKDTHYSGAKDLGHGVGYQYPHNFPNGWVYQEYLPDDLIGKAFYEPTESGHEQRLSKIFQRLEQLQQEHRNKSQ